jgi:magnesium transporter
MPHPLFSPEIRDMLAQNDTAGLAALCEELHPATIAEAVDEGFTPEEIWQLISDAEIRTQAAIFEYLPIDMQEQMVENSARPQVGRLIEKMSHDDRVDLLRRLPTRVSENLLRLVDDADRRDIKTLFNYDEGTVGAMLTTDYAWLPPHLTAAEAVDQLRQQAPDKETIYYIYVLDEAKRRPEGGLAPRKLLGIISLRDLILAPRHKLLSDLMEEELVSLKYSDDRQVAADLLARYDFIAVPVLDDDGGMLGIVTHDDAIDVIQEEATEDLQRQGGVTPFREGYLDASFFKIYRSRAFWLSLLFAAELITFTVLKQFEELIAQVVVLSLFIPLAISTGGNSGSQASTLVTRALALGEVTRTVYGRLLRREILMGLALGLTLGLIGFFRGAFTSDDTRGGPEKVSQDVVAVLPTDAILEPLPNGDYALPKGTRMETDSDKVRNVRLKAGTFPTIGRQGEHLVLTIPAESELRSDPVDAHKLGFVIGLSVLFICLWGTLIGTCLPLMFRQFGLDPAVASGPFVATFVDVTGIFIFFKCASQFLL